MPTPKRSLIRGADGLRRCAWCGDDPLYVAYHDREWGQPVFDDHRLFEKICLEGFQAGLSWITILRKRDAFREAFFDFDFQRVARMTSADVTRLLKDARIVRHRGKIESTINNANQALALREEFGTLASYFWTFQAGRRPALRSMQEVVSTSDESKRLSRDLKRRGWSFVGPTTCYAFMQAMGLVNDHLHGCHAWKTVENARRELKRR